VPLGGTQHALAIAEVGGGDWNKGKAIFFSGFPGCARCHSIRGTGGRIAPDLSNLVERDYTSVLRDIEQPSATINPDYPQYAVELKDGRILQGVIVESTAAQIRLGDITGMLTALPKANIASTHALATSLMPEGLIAALSAEQKRDLLTFLLLREPHPAP
jgi:putative heme-binding domain-containing protein